jgi:hypothetical protein
VKKTYHARSFSTTTAAVMGVEPTIAIAEKISPMTKKASVKFEKVKAIAVLIMSAIRIPPLA